MQPIIILSIFLDSIQIAAWSTKTGLQTTVYNYNYIQLMCIPSEPHDLYNYSVAKNLLPKLRL